jgi:hypothetical protein
LPDADRCNERERDAHHAEDDTSSAGLAASRRDRVEARGLLIRLLVGWLGRSRMRGVHGSRREIDGNGGRHPEHGSLRGGECARRRIFGFAVRRCFLWNR